VRTRLEPGDLVKVEALRTQPSCLYHGPVTVDVCQGVYLGIPRFEFTVAQVRMTDGSIRRYPLEYLTPAVAS
jgi:hypothetical protein